MQFRLLTNNPKKVETLEKFGLKIYERIPLTGEAHSRKSLLFENKTTEAWAFNEYRIGSVYILIEVFFSFFIC